MNPQPTIEPIPFLSSNTVSVEVLRLDKIHPIVSGNKWYKLRYYLQDAIDNKASTIASFGGPYSNHLVALSYAAKINGLNSIGYVRSNPDEAITPTLQEAVSYGMQLIHIGRSTFQTKKNELLADNSNIDNLYFVDEGGYGLLGAKGAQTIVSDCEIEHDYDYIVCAVGTGTMIAGMINGSPKNQCIIGIPVLKNEGTIKDEIIALLNDKQAKFELLHQFHQGGYAKTTSQQIEYMNELWDNTQIPTDIVYTGKVFYAVSQLLNQAYFKPNSKVLVIHSGGLQGNRSLGKGILHF